MACLLSLFNTFVEFISVGEKYELAKKLTKIKLVNHRWLEDWYVHLHSLMLKSSIVYIDDIATA